MNSPSQLRSPEGLDSPSSTHPHKAQYPFPRISSPQREGDAGQRGASPFRLSRQTSIGSITSSIRLDTKSLDDNGPFDELSQNAISTLLQPPIVRTGLVAHQSLPASAAHRQPSARDIPPVALANIRHVEPSVFKPYLSQVGNLFSSYQRAKLEGDETNPQLFRRDESSNEAASSLLGRSIHQRSSSISSTTSSRYEALSPSDSPVVKPFSPNSTPRRKQQAVARLDTIPNVYFESEFHLENPRIFDIVSERAEVVPHVPGTSDDKAANGSLKQPGGSRKALHTNAILQEKLSWYMDTVEVHLISSIAVASSSFFAALGSLKELHAEAADSIAQIKTLRAALEKLDREMAEGGMKIVRMRRRRENLRKLGQAANQLCEVIELASKCEELVDDGQLNEASAQIERLESLLAGQPARGENGESRIDLRQLRALDGIPEGITQLRIRIGKGFESLFIDALLKDLRQHVKTVTEHETLQRWAHASLRSRGDHSRSQSVIHAYVKTNDQLRSDLLSALAGLDKSGHTGRAGIAYREAILREIRSMIRTHLPSSNDDDMESVTSVSTRGGRKLTQGEKSSILARNLRALEPEAAEELLVKVYTSVSEALRRLGIQAKVVLDVTSSIERPADENRTLSPIRSPQGHAGESGGRSHPSHYFEEVHQALDLSNLLGAAVDAVQTQVSKVLKVRSQQSVQLPLQQFLRYFTLNRLFADECEAVSGRSGEPIKSAINAQIGEFLKYMSEKETQFILKALESDRWEAKDFMPADREVLSRVLDGMTRTPPSWTSYSQMWDNSSANSNGHPSHNGAEISSDKALRNAVIDEQKFVLVAAASSILCSIEHYENLIAGIPSIAADASMKLVELLKLFNSRCVQLILGSGARQTANLKSITTKHLALASQTISFVVALVPYVREFVRRQSSAGATIAPEFDKVKRLFQDHQVGIHDKLIEIMSDRSRVHVLAMKKIDWDDDASASSPSAYMETLTKETATLQKVLSRHVSEMDVMMIMSPIFTNYTQDWTQAFQQATVKTEAGRARMLRDIECLDARFRKIDSSVDLGKKLTDIVKDKAIAKEKVAAPEPEPEGKAFFDAEAPTPYDEQEEAAATAPAPAEEASEQDLPVEPNTDKAQALTGASAPNGDISGPASTSDLPAAAVDTMQPSVDTTNANIGATTFDQQVSSQGAEVNAAQLPATATETAASENSPTVTNNESTLDASAIEASASASTTASEPAAAVSENTITIATDEAEVPPTAAEDATSRDPEPEPKFEPERELEAHSEPQPADPESMPEPNLEPQAGP